MAAAQRAVPADARTGQRHRYRHAAAGGSVDQALGPAGGGRELSRRRRARRHQRFRRRQRRSCAAGVTPLVVYRPSLHVQEPALQAERSASGRPGVEHVIVIAVPPTCRSNRSPSWSPWRARSPASSTGGHHRRHRFPVRGFSEERRPEHVEVRIATRSKLPTILPPDASRSTKRVRHRAAAVEAGKVKLLAVTNSTRAPICRTAHGHRGRISRPGARRTGRLLRPARHAALAARTDRRRRPRGRLRNPVIEERLTATGQIPNFGGPAEFHAQIEHQRARVAAAAKNVGVEPTQ